MSESDEQIAVVAHCRAKGYPVYHVPNGGMRSKREAALFKRMGVSAGVPDLCVPVARGGCHGLYIELKARNGRLSEAQRKWLDALRGEGYCAFCCVGRESAIELVDAYMEGRVVLGGDSGGRSFRLMEGRSGS